MAIQPGTTVGTGVPDRILDRFSGALAAYGLRDLRRDYTGSAVRVRRDSDDAEMDFAASEIGDGTLSSWLGTANGFVVTAYDQSGNGRDATQATLSNQPPLTQDASGRWYVDTVENADTLSVGGYQPTSYLESYSLPSIGGATVPFSSASGDYTIRRPFETWIVYPDTMGTTFREDVARVLEGEALFYDAGTIASLDEHFRGHGAMALSGSAGIGRWDTSQVTNMRVMFYNTSVSDLSPLSGWDTSQVTDMGHMFRNTSVSDLSPLSGWDTSQVTDMGFMFRSTSVSDLSPLSGWDTSQVTNMRFMFQNTSVSDLSPLSNWDTSQVTYMNRMFRNTSVSDLSPLSGWDTSQVTNMRFMFQNTSVSDLSPLSNWDTSQVTDMGFMFRSTSVSDLSPLSGWDTSQVTDMSFMFRNTSVSDPSTISGWDVGAVTDLQDFLEGAPLDDVPTGDMLDGWTDGSPNAATDMQSGVTLGIQNADYAGMDAGGQAAVDALCADPPNWTINVTNAPADCA